ncbi:Embryogenesis-associated protein [Nymphaea thermarum]|nr:Embryogenesis-associated protein [Nymphaea thermarum]
MSAHILSRLLPRVRAGASVPSASGSADIHPSLEVIGGDRFPLQALGRSYRPLPLIGSNRHVETIFAAFFRSLPDVRYRRECLRTADGGALALDWPVGADDQRLASDAPVLILLFYSASFTEDLRQVVYHVGHCFPYSKLYAAGWSLGANILVRYLGQEAHSCPLAGAASLCNPFDLVVADEDFHKGFNVIYDKALARALRRIFKKHTLLFEGIGGEYNIELTANAKSVREFDDGLTRVSFGYKSVDDYYFDASSSHSIEHVQTPLLCIQASNDPIAPSRGIPREQIRENPHCLLIVTPKGGHLGWVAGDEAPFGCPWTDSVVMDFFEHIQENKTDSSLHGAEGAKSCKASLEVMV